MNRHPSLSNARKILGHANQLRSAATPIAFESPDGAVSPNGSTGLQPEKAIAGLVIGNNFSSRIKLIWATRPP